MKLMALVFFLFAVLSSYASIAHSDIVKRFAEVQSDNGEIRPVTFYLTRNDDKEVLYKLICKGWSCPDFEVVNDVTPFIQKRKYDSYATVATTVSGCGNFSDLQLKGYMDLFRYRRGDNDKGSIIAMSVPVMTEVDTTNETSFCELQIRFFMNQTDDLLGLPKPTDPNVRLEVIPSLEVYVTTYGGHLNDIEENWNRMEEDLDKLGLCYNKKKYFVAMYDPPWKKRGRRNEIWAQVLPC